ncbi:MAG: hypothetical protein V1820_02025 [archaeon]
MQRQKDLFGRGARRSFKFAKAFSPKKRTGSAGEDRIAAFLSEKGVSFKRHGIISRTARLSEKEKSALIIRSCPRETFALLSREFSLEKIHPELFRYDFLVEGFREGTKRAVVCIEYLGLYRPAARVDKKSFRRRHVRQVAFYTFFKTPLKREVYRRAGIEIVEILPGELENLESILAPVLDALSQEKATLSGWLSSSFP